MVAASVGAPNCFTLIHVYDFTYKRCHSFCLLATQELVSYLELKHKSLHKQILSFKDFFSKCDQSQIWLHLLKNSLTENFIFCEVNLINFTSDGSVMMKNQIEKLWLLICSKIQQMTLICSKRN